MGNDSVKELWGVQFFIVPEGLAEEQVVNFVDGLIARSQNGSEGKDHHSALFSLAAQTVVEATNIAESTKEQARQEADAEAARIRSKAEEEAREQARQVLETARNEAHAKSSKIIATADEEAQQTLRSTRREAHEILQAAKQAADDLQAQAKIEGELTVQKLKARLTDD